MSLLEQAIEAHGGAERWAATEALDVALYARGPAFTLKGRRGRQVRAVMVAVGEGGPWPPVMTRVSPSVAT